MSTWNTDSVDKFLKTVSQARSFNSREIRLSLQEAEDLAISLAMILSQESRLTHKVLELQEQLSNMSPAPSGSNMGLSGGSF